jgi:AhpD family alkylhydroperoxidase
MAHIKVPDNLPGILGSMAISTESTKALRELAEVLLRGPNTLTPERENIATYVSSQNDCCFCQLSHGAAAAEHLGGNYELIDRIKQNFGASEISEKLKAPLAIAGKVQ